MKIVIEICRLCFNRSNEYCIPCFREGEMTEFELHPNASLVDLSEFPIKEFMETLTPHVRQVLVGAYLKLIVDYLGGPK